MIVQPLSRFAVQRKQSSVNERGCPMKKKGLSILLALALVLSLPVSALAADFSDLDGHWAQAYMEDLADQRLFLRLRGRDDAAGR